LPQNFGILENNGASGGAASIIVAIFGSASTIFFEV
jgi:hypothetical protein